MRELILFLCIMICSHENHAAEKEIREVIDLTGDNPVVKMEPVHKRSKKSPKTEVFPTDEVSPTKVASPTRSALKRSPSPKKKGNVTFH